MALVTDQEWDEYKAKFEKSYQDKSEDEMRRELYAKVKAKVQQHNIKYEAGEWQKKLKTIPEAFKEDAAATTYNLVLAPF